MNRAGHAPAAWPLPRPDPDPAHSASRGIGPHCPAVVPGASCAMPERCFDTPLGPMTVTETDGAITGLRWGEGQTDPGPLLDEAVAQLEDYFAGERESFDLPLEVEAGPLVRAVCDEMRTIPFGDTLTYGEIAARVGAPPQAVGQSCGANPIPVIIPCHRVLAANGLGGFSGAGGVESKVWLLRHEKAGGLLI